MKKQALAKGYSELAYQRALLVALGNDLSLPLLQIKSTVELLQSQNFSKASLRSQALVMDLSAETGLQLVEAYQLALKASEDDALTMEPVVVGAVLQDIAHLLTPYAKQYNTELQVDVLGRLAPVLAHKASLTAALQCLSTSMIRAQAAQTQESKYRLLLGAHRGADNFIAAGVFCNVNGLSDRTLRAARHLVGRARQPLAGVPASAAGGVLIADMLSSAMWQPLRAAAHRNMNGLAIGVPITKQMQFI